MEVKAILETIAAQVGSGEMSFATHADVAMQVRRAIDDPDCSSERLCTLLSAEPLLSAKIVGLANSVAYNPSGRTVGDLRAAVTRIGFSAVRTLATAFIVRQMRELPKNPEHKVLAARLWEHTAHVAALARVIARRVTKRDPEAAFFAGIVHDMGGFLVLARAAEYPELLGMDAELWQEDGEARLGRAVLEALGVPESTLEACALLWRGYLTLPPESLGDTLLLADDLAPVASPLSDLPAPRRDGCAADMDLQIGEDTLNGILADSAEEISSLLAVLHG